MWIGGDRDEILSYQHDSTVHREFSLYAHREDQRRVREMALKSRITPFTVRKVYRRALFDIKLDAGLPDILIEDKDLQPRCYRSGEGNTDFRICRVDASGLKSLASILYQYATRF